MRRMIQIQVERDLLADKGRRALKSFESFFDFLFFAFDDDENLGIAQVIRDDHVGDGHCQQARVFHLITDHFRYLLA